MFNSILDAVQSFIVTNASWTVFLGCIVEQVVVPIPASLIVLSTTYLLLQGAAFSLETLATLIIRIVIPASLGITIGSFVYYIAAYKLGKPFIKRTSKFLGVTLEDVESVEEKFKESRYEDVFIFIARCLPIIPSIAVNLFCGLVRYDIKRYLLTTFFGSAVQILGWGLLAWLFGSLYHVLESRISLLADLIFVLIILALIGFVIYRKIYQKKREKD